MQGYYFDGETSKKHDVSITIDPSEVRIYCLESRRLLSSWPRNKIIINQLGEKQSEIRYRDHDHAYLIVGKRDLITQGLVNKTAVYKNPKYLVAILLTASVFLMGFLFVLIPKASYEIAHRLPPSWDIQLGNAINPLFIKDTCEHDQAERITSQLVDRLTKEIYTPIPIHVYVVRMPIANAFALPGGAVILTSALIAKAESSDEIAGVLAHEIGHVLGRHSMARLMQSGAVGIVWTAVLGDLSGPAIVAPLIARQVLESSYSRKAEVEADNFAIKMLDQAQISRQGLIDFFQRFADLEGEPAKAITYLSSHPTSAERVNNLYHNMNHQHERSALSAEDWQTLKEVCD